MDGMLSQDEINALLSGMDLSGGAESNDNAAASTTTDSVDAISGMDDMSSGDDFLTDVEKDAIGEVANISMGSSATTLYTLVNRKVNITTPVVTLATWDNLIQKYEAPCVFIQIKYTTGLDGSNILVLKEHDVKVITDLMMGGDGTNIEGELGELHLSAISEAMNQMMGSSATSLSTMLKTVIDISPPNSSLLDLAQLKSGSEIAPFLDGSFVKIEFRMQIDELVDSTIMQLYPIDFAKDLVKNFMHTQADELGMDEGDLAGGAASSSNNSSSSMNSAPSDSGINSNQMSMDSMGMNPMGMNSMGMDPMGMNQMGMNPMGMNQMGMNPMGMNPMGMNPMGMNPMPMNNVNIQPAQFQNFSGDVNNIQGQENIGIIMDVPLEVTVELGRTSKSISEILNFAPGTIIELDRIAGEPIDVLVNGKFVAKGEVVVIEESFAIRITEIIK